MKRNWRSFGIVLVLISCFFFQARAGKDSLGIRTIVIDPGHGGSDPGCIGPTKTHEADVALAISLKLGKMIEDKYGDRIKVIYTRTKDEFVDLGERAKIANRNNADLFICVHANSGPSHAKGSETYVLGLHKSDAQAKVMQRENDVILLEDDHETKYEKLDPNDPDLAILLEYKMTLYLDQSIEFANLIQKNIVSTEGYSDRGVKQAGFLVLHQVNMPSVLVETGFLTNPDEEKILTNDSYQTKMATAIFDAFVDYKSLVDKRNGITTTETAERKVNEKEKVVKEEVKLPEKTNIPETNAVVNNNSQNVEKNKVDKDKVIFKVQITTSSKEIELKSTNFKGLEEVEMYTDGGMYKYTYGKSNNFDEAIATQDFARQNGYPSSAFVVAFKNGERIKDIKVARDMANNK